MEDLKGLALGILPDNFPFKYESEFDPESPWSLILAFYPETRPLQNVDFKVSDSPVELDPSVRDFVANECIRLGWSQSNSQDEDVKTYFMKARLRQTDEACRQLVIPARIDDSSMTWINGVVRVLQLWRHLNDNSPEPSLKVFEEWSPETVFQHLISFEPLGWDLRQRLEFLVLPYLRYKSRTDLIQSWVNEVDNIDSLREAMFIPELAGSLLQICLQSRIEDWRSVQLAVENIKPLNTQSEESKDSELTWDSLLVPTAQTLEFMSNLVEVAKLGKLPAPRFHQLAEWSLGSESLQEDVLIRFVQSSNHFSSQELSALRKTVLSKLDEAVIVRETVRAALGKSRLVYIKTHAIKSYPEIVREEVMALVSKFDALSPDVQLSQVITGLMLFDDVPELLAKYEKLKSMASSFGIDPTFAMTHEPLENVARALELDTNAYLRYTDLVKYVGGEENSAKVAEQCVESALADDNFDAVVEFIDRAFVQNTSPTAWIAYYQAGKYVSPSWDLPRSHRVLEKQLDFLSTALSICPEGDMLSVLRTWSATDMEMSEVKAQLLVEQAGKTRESSPLDLLRDSYVGSGDSRKSGGEGARDQISNLLVSGIGWAIGANQ